MKRPLDYQMVIADAEGTTSHVAVRFGIERASVLRVRKLVRDYRQWEALVIAEAALPLSERRIEFMPLSRHTRNALRRGGLKTAADLLGMTPDAVLSIRSAGKATIKDIQRYFEREEVDDERTIWVRGWRKL